MKKKKIRPLGDILLDLEVLIDEAIDDHELQDVDLYSLLRGHIESHRPDCKMEYVDGTFPEMYFGPRREK
jgi:hypothetical protein